MRRILALTVVALALGALGALAPAAGAKQRVSANPNPVAFGETLVVKGRGWPVIEFCGRTVRLSLRSDQNAFRIGTVRTSDRGRFRFEWIPRGAKVGAGDWTLVARMRCESGKDGSPVPVLASTPVRIGAFNFVIGRGTTATARWSLYARRGRFGGFCVGVAAGPPDGLGGGGSGEGCGGGLHDRALTLGFGSFRRRGTFAFGMAALSVARVEVRFGADAPVPAMLFASPPALDFRGRFWIATRDRICDVVSAEAFAADGASLGEAEMPGPPRNCP